MIEELRELAEWFRARGMADNADFLESVAVRLETPPAAILGKAGGKKSRRVLTTEQAKAMVKARGSKRALQIETKESV